MRQIALVEDDALLREELKSLFEHVGYEVHEALHYEGLVDILRHHTPELLILDINLPGPNGYTIADQVKASHPSIGIVMLTAKTRSADHVRGYQSGADIYLTKPTDTDELLAACESLHRRLENSDSRPALILEVKAQSLVRQTKSPNIEQAGHEDEGTEQTPSVPLTLPELLILRALALSPERELATGDAIDILAERLPKRRHTRRALENIISRLRGKITAAGADGPHLIQSVRGHGYVLTEPVVVRA